MNNLDELSKPVAEVNSKYGDPEAFGERELKVLADIQEMPYETKFYSQGYIDFLIAQLEAVQKELSDWRSVAEAAAQDDADWHKLTDSKNEVIVNLALGVGLLIDRAEKAEAALSAANEKLKGEQVPVGLIEAGLPSVNDGEFVYVVRSKQFIPYGTSLFTAPQKPVVLPERYSFEVCATPDPNGEWVAVDEIIEAIKAAGGKVEGGDNG
ncbi:TPA: hypothetical protein PXQ99_003360 [Yersinia enterocolitica]|nr:hypothetical protein [Yersinia enterocolitica]